MPNKRIRPPSIKKPYGVAPSPRKETLSGVVLIRYLNEEIQKYKDASLNLNSDVVMRQINAGKYDILTEVLYHIKVNMLKVATAYKCNERRCD